MTRSDAARKAMEILKAECFACHNEEKKKGGLVLTSRELLLKGNPDGAVVVSGKPDESRLAKALLRDADPHMPPKKQLTDAQIKTMRDWIKAGLGWDAKVLADDEVNVAPVKLAPLPASYQPVMALALSPDGKRLAVGRGGSIVVHDAAQTNFPVVAQFEAHRDAVQAIAWSSDARWLASGAFRRLVLWDAETFNVEREWTNGLVGCVTAIEFSPDGGTLALADSVAGQGGYLRLIDPVKNKITASWRAHGDTIFDLDFSRDGTQLGSAGGDKLIRIWELSSKKESARIEGHYAGVGRCVQHQRHTGRQRRRGQGDQGLGRQDPRKNHQPREPLGPRDRRRLAGRRKGDRHGYRWRRRFYLHESQIAHRRAKFRRRRREKNRRRERIGAVSGGRGGRQNNFRRKPRRRRPRLEQRTQAARETCRDDQRNISNV